MKEKIKVASEFRQQKIRASTLGNNTQFVLARVFFFFRLGRETKSIETVSFDFGISNGTTGQGNFSEYKSSLTALNVAALNMINTTQTMLDSIRAFLLGINRSKKHSTIRFASFNVFPANMNLPELVANDLSFGELSHNVSKHVTEPSRNTAITRKGFFES